MRQTARAHRRVRSTIRRHPRRGTVMFAVLFLVVIASLSAASMLTATAAERRAAVRSVDDLELRLAVRSALAVATADLARQRDAMLAGEDPDLPGTVRIDRGEPDTDNPPPAIVVEFVSGSAGLSAGSLAEIPAGMGGSTGTGFSQGGFTATDPYEADSFGGGFGGGNNAALTPEAARLDLNTAPVASLAALPGMPAGLAEAIDRRRRTAPFRSPAEALLLDPIGAGASAGSAADDASIDGRTDGPMESGRTGAAPSSNAPAGTGNTSGGGLQTRSSGDRPSAGAPASRSSRGSSASGYQSTNRSDTARGWFDLVTVFAADPTVSVGAADGERTGTPRVNINAPWSENIENALLDAAGDTADDSLRTLFVDAPRLTKPSVLVGLLADNGVPPERWGALLDAVTTTPDPFRLGLVDINRAPAEVLATLPGLDPDSAEAIVSARERIDLADRLSVAWPLTEGVVDETQFRAFVDVVTVRTLQWRFTLRASFADEADDFVGFDPGDGPGELLPEADEFGVAIDDEDRQDTGPTLTFEVVLDLAGDRPRIAYLRERTAYDLALRVASLPGMNRDANGENADGVRTAAGAGDSGWNAGGPEGDEADFLGEPASFDDLGFGEPAGLEDAGEYSALDGMGEFGDPFGLDLEGDETDPAGDPDAGGENGLPSAGTSRRGSASNGGTSAGQGRDNRLGRWAPPRSAPTPQTESDDSDEASTGGNGRQPGGNGQNGGGP